MQMPFVHVCPDAHALLHEPQAAGSLFRLRHAAAVPVPQSICPAVWHTQVLLLQDDPAGQARPHIPQFKLLLTRLTHAPPVHCVSPAAHGDPPVPPPPVPPRPAVPP